MKSFSRQFTEQFPQGGPPLAAGPQQSPGSDETHADVDVHRRALNIDKKSWDNIAPSEIAPLANIRHKGVVYGPVPVVVLSKPQKRNYTDKHGKLVTQNFVKVKVKAKDASVNSYKIDKDSESGYGELPFELDDMVLDIPVEDLINFGYPTGETQPLSPPAGGMSLMASAKFVGFKQWFNEVGTSTSSVAGFSRPIMGPVRRTWIAPWGQEDPFFKKKKKF